VEGAPNSESGLAPEDDDGFPDCTEVGPDDLREAGFAGAGFFDDLAGSLPCPGAGAGACDCRGAGDGDDDEDGSRLGSLTGNCRDGVFDDLEGFVLGRIFGTALLTPPTTPDTSPLTGFVDALAGAGASSETATVTTAVPVTNGTARATVDFHSPDCLGDRA